jgi:hypothetical protein
MSETKETMRMKDQTHEINRAGFLPGSPVDGWLRANRGIG